LESRFTKDGIGFEAADAAAFFILRRSTVDVLLGRVTPQDAAQKLRLGCGRCSPAGSAPTPWPVVPVPLEAVSECCRASTAVDKALGEAIRAAVAEALRGETSRGH